MAHVRKSIRDNIVTAVTSLSTTGARVYRLRIYPLETATNLPGLCVYTLREASEAVIEGQVTKDQENYSIAGRSLSCTPIAYLLSLPDYYRTEFIREKRVERRNNGVGTGARAYWRGSARRGRLGRQIGGFKS